MLKIVFSNKNMRVSVNVYSQGYLSLTWVISPPFLFLSLIVFPSLFALLPLLFLFYRSLSLLQSFPTPLFSFSLSFPLSVCYPLSFSIHLSLSAFMYDCILPFPLTHTHTFPAISPYVFSLHRIPCNIHFLKFILLIYSFLYGSSHNIYGMIKSMVWSTWDNSSKP